MCIIAHHPFLSKKKKHLVRFFWIRPLDAALQVSYVRAVVNITSLNLEGVRLVSEHHFK